jgi:tRNA A-37 threonylcarbamoyl transferase component Bud32
MKTNLLILAAGEGRRNAHFTFDNALPKCLMSVGNETILEAIINSYSAIELDRIVVVCQSKHIESINAILKYKGLSGVELRILDDLLGTTLSVLHMLNDSDLQNNWFINWSDVYAPIAYQPKHSTIFIDNELQHRNYIYHCSDTTLAVASTCKSEGNVPGIFYMLGKDLQNINRGHNDFDMAITSSQDNFDKLLLHKLSDIVDTGDYDKYTKLRTKASKSNGNCRYFNSIEIGKDYVKKSPRTDAGLALHKTELAYYRNFTEDTAFAKLLSYDRSTKTMTLEKIKGQTCQEFYDNACKSLLTKHAKQQVGLKLFNDFLEAIQTVHSQSVEDVYASDVILAMSTEFIDAVAKRVAPVKPLIDAMLSKHAIKSINGMPITENYHDLLSGISNWFDHSCNTFDLAITHGDPNTDNCMISGKQIRLIDPRGYFGTSLPLGHGVKEYDYAKFLYGLSGYSHFNAAAFVTTKVEDYDLKTFMNMDELEGITDYDIFYVNAIPVKNPENIQMLIGIIWLKLSSYIINDPVKSVLAYLHGNAIVTKVLSKN